MHSIEPYFKWRNQYIASEDKLSPFFGAVYDEFKFTNKIYNYFIHPQWDSIGSPTLYAKLIFVAYEQEVAIIELIGEWNDLINNDIMWLKNELLNPLLSNGVRRFVLMCDNVLNFHGEDDCYYEEWWDDIKEEDGWVAILNTREHVEDEMKKVGIQYYLHFGDKFADIEWQGTTPIPLIQSIDALVRGQIKKLDY